MACQIKYSPSGQIHEVLDTTGKPSKLYKSIAKHPLVKDKGVALEIYKNVYGSKINNEENEFATRVNGNFTVSYKEAVDIAKEGDKIEVGFFDKKSDFHPIITTEMTTNPNTVEGFVNLQIKNNILSDEKTFDREGTFFKPKGKTSSARAMNAALLEEELRHGAGLAGFKRHKDQRYSINGIKPKQQYAEGSTDSKISQMLSESSMMRTFGSDKTGKKLNLSEKELKVRLLNLLSDLGVKVMSITDYVDKYNKKNGVDPSAVALADIAERIVAFNDGEIGLSDLTEEVAHFIVEGLPQDQVENVLRHIDKTPEYLEFASHYKEIYKNDYTGEALEQAVRKEVLGKVLAKSLKSEFSTEGKQGILANIINKIKELFHNFMGNVNGYTNMEQRTEISDFAKRVKDEFISGSLIDSLNQENFQGNKFRFYSTQQASNKGDNNQISMIKSRSLAAIEILKRQIKDLAKTGKASGVSREQLKQAAITLQDKLNSLEEEEVMHSMTTFLEVTRKQIDYIESALKNNERGNYSLSQEEVAVYQSLLNDMSPILAELRERVKTKKGTQWSVIAERISNSLDSINVIRGKKEVIEDDVLNKLVDKVIERHNLDETKYRPYIEAWYKTAQKDTSYFHATFGQLIHAHDPLLSLAGMVIQDTMNEGRINYLKATKQFQQRLKELGLKEKDLDQFFDKGYLVDVVDHKAFEDSLLEMRLKVLQEFSDEAKNLSIEELKRRYKSPSPDPKNTLPKVDPTKEIEMNAEIKKRQNKMVERVMKKEYYEEQENRYKKAGVSQVTINFLKAISQTRGSILAAARKDNGTVDKTLLTEGELSRLHELVRDRKKAKSPYTSSGNLKRGLIPNPNSGEHQPAYILDPSVTPSNEATIAADIHAIDALYRKEAEEKGIIKNGVTDLFMEGLREASMLGHEEALKFLRLNSTMNFSEDFWGYFGEGQSLIDRFDEVIDNTTDTDAKRHRISLRDNYKDALDRRKNILKIYQNPNNPAEVDVDRMDKGTRDEVRDLTERINDLSISIYNSLPESEQRDVIHEQTTNKAYQDALEDNNIKSPREETEFIKDHVTKSDMIKILQLQGFLTDYKRGLAVNPPPAFRRYIENNIDLDHAFNVEVEVRNYARTKLLPYYKRMAPEGYDNMMNQLETGGISVLDFVDDVTSGRHFLEINADYSFIQEESDMVNPNYRANYEGGYLQPKHGEYKNQKFEELFAPKRRPDGSYAVVINKEGIEEYIPTKNQNLYKGYEALKQFQRENLDQIGELGSHNLFKLPQISKSRLEKIVAFANKASGERVKEAWKDFSMYRVDELERGAEFDGYTLSNSKVIPKYYTRDLENEDDISRQLFTSYAAFAQQAYLHRARRNNIGDMFAIREKLLNRDTGHLNKTASSTSTYKMFKSYMDANFFGVTEQSNLTVNVLGRDLDLTKLARRFLNFIKFKNLGLSAIVPATSWLTAEVNSKIEAIVKEHTNTRSAQMAFQEFRKLAPDAAKEFMKINGEAKLTVLGEFLGIFDSGNRYKDASYDASVRFGWKMGMGLHQAANFPIIPRIMLSVLYDYRVVEGNIVNYNTFARTQRADNPAITDKELDAEWAKYEGDAVYEFLDIDKTTVNWKKNEIGKKLGMTGEKLDAFLENKLHGIQSRIEEATSNIDGSISEHRQIAASRHYLLNYFMTHRNWLSIATSRRFKLDQYNLQTGEQEEGSWVSLYKFMGDYIKDVSSTNRKDYRDAIKEKWANASEMERKNLRRVGVDIAVLNAMALLGYLIANAADDEENEDLWALQLSNYLFHRTLNETASSSLALPYQYLEAVESPFVGLNTVQELGKIPKFFDSEEIKYGKYRGMSVAQRQLVKTVPGIKQYREVANPKEASDTYRFYNDRNFNMIPLNWFLNGED